MTGDDLKELPSVAGSEKKRKYVYICLIVWCVRECLSDSLSLSVGKVECMYSSDIETVALGLCKVCSCYKSLCLMLLRALKKAISGLPGNSVALKSKPKG